MFRQWLAIIIAYYLLMSAKHTFLYTAQVNEG